MPLHERLCRVWRGGLVVDESMFSVALEQILSRGTAVKTLREWWTDLSIRISVCLVLSASVPLAYYIACPCSQAVSAWAPSLACNLFTTGLAVFFINYLLARRESQRQVNHAALGLIEALGSIMSAGEETLDLWKSTSNTDENHTNLLGVWRQAEAILLRASRFTLHDLTLEARTRLQAIETAVSTISGAPLHHMVKADESLRGGLLTIALPLIALSRMLYGSAMPDFVARAEALRDAAFEFEGERTHREREALGLPRRPEHGAK